MTPSTAGLAILTVAALVGAGVFVVVTTRRLDAAESRRRGAEAETERGRETNRRLVTCLGELERRHEEWASAVAHDLRQPVSTIALSAGILLKKLPEIGVPEAERRHAERIKTSAARLTRMIDDLLNAWKPHGS